MIEQRLDLLRPRGQSDGKQENALQEKARKEQTSALQAGIEGGRPLFPSTDGNCRVELGGCIHLDCHAAEEDTKTLVGIKLRSQCLIRCACLKVDGRFFRWIDCKPVCLLCHPTDAGRSPLVWRRPGVAGGSCLGEVRI